MSVAKCLNAVMLSQLEGKATMTAEEQATLATIGANMEMRVRDFRDFLTACTRGAIPEASGARAIRLGPPSCCTYVAGTCGTGWNRTGQHGTRRDNDSKSFRAATR